MKVDRDGFMDPEQWTFTKPKAKLVEKCSSLRLTPSREQSIYWIRQLIFQLICTLCHCIRSSMLIKFEYTKTILILQYVKNLRINKCILRNLCVCSFHLLLKQGLRGLKTKDNKNLQNSSCINNSPVPQFPAHTNI